MDIKKTARYYTLTNSKGASVVLSELGACIVSICVPDKDGKLADVVLGYDSQEAYYHDGPFLGKVPGRFANRIANGKFTLDGVEYTLPINNGPNSLHGGPEGFAERIWDSRVIGDAVEFMYFSEDGEQGYPGNLKAVAHYEWSEDCELKLTFTAECDAPTVVNLTNHVYFNLDGEGRRKKSLILRQLLETHLAAEEMPSMMALTVSELTPPATASRASSDSSSPSVEASSRPRPSSGPRKAAAWWRSSPPSPASRSIPATGSQAAPWASPAMSTATITA